MSQAIHARSSRRRGVLGCLYGVALIGALLVAAFAGSYWAPNLTFRAGAAATTASQEPEPGGESGHAHADHGHAGHDETNSIELSPQAQKTIGLELAKVKLGSYLRSVTIPGMIVQKDGQSTVKATALLTGIITRVYVIEGAAVVAGDPLFDIRLTHEELVQAQADLLKTAEELRVVEREIKRLEAITADGAVPRKTLLERQYEQQKLQAHLNSQRQALQLHGLTQEQVQGILKAGKLVAQLTVRAPEAASGNREETVYQVSDLLVTQGQSVEAGATLAVLANHAELFIEGNAFESDLQAIARASREGWPISAKVAADGGSNEIATDLKVLYVAGKVDPESRTLHFYVSLPNERERDATTEDGRRFLSWRFRPGQRVEIEIPVERWEERIVLPLSAVAQDGVENYVFIANGDHFDRRPVHVEFRDTKSVIIASDGSVFPGTPIAMTGAQQLQIALKGKSGGAIDPHAGHSH